MCTRLKYKRQPMVSFPFICRADEVMDFIAGHLCQCYVLSFLVNCPGTTYNYCCWIVDGHCFIVTELLSTAPLEPLPRLSRLPRACPPLE